MFKQPSPNGLLRWEDACSAATGCCKEAIKHTLAAVKAPALKQASHTLAWGRLPGGGRGGALGILSPTAGTMGSQ